MAPLPLPPGRPPAEALHMQAKEILMHHDLWSGCTGSEAEEPAPGTSSGLSYFAFPTLEQLAEATETELRADGFGYRWEDTQPDPPPPPPPGQQ